MSADIQRMKTDRQNQGLNQISIVDVEEVTKNKSSTLESQTQTQLVLSREDSIPIIPKLPTSKIILNAETIPFFHGFLGIALIAGITVCTLIVTWWPQHNVVLFPEYWFEPIPLFFFILSKAVQGNKPANGCRYIIRIMTIIFCLYIGITRVITINWYLYLNVIKTNLV